MGNTEKLSLMFTAFVLGLAGVLVAVYQGGQPDWGPLGDLLTELTTAAGAGTASFVIMQHVKKAMPGASSKALFLTHLAIVAIMAPAAWLGLVALNLTELTERGAIVVAGVAFAAAKLVYQQYKDAHPDPDPGRPTPGGRVNA